MNEQSQAVTRTTGTKVASLRDRLESPEFLAAVSKSLPKHLTPERFIRVAITAMTKTPKLAQCSQASFFNAMLTLSQYGIEADGRRAHLIPFENRKAGTVDCQLILDYKGIAELVMRSGLVSYLHADVVCENDLFEYDMGEIKTHKIDFRKPRGSVYAAYCICKFKDGTCKADVMSRDEIESIRARSKAGNSGPWITDWNEMGKKTIFKRLSKWLPLSAEVQDLLDVDDDEFRHQPKSQAVVENRVVPTFVIPEAQPEPSTKPEDAIPMEPTVPSSPAPAKVEPTAQDRLIKAVEGVSYDDFRDAAQVQWNIDLSRYDSYEQLPDEVCERMLKSPQVLEKYRKTFGKV